MILPFYKYHGTGNDFVIVNQMMVGYLKDPDPSLVHQICRRRFGVGGDGLIFLERSDIADFKMVYYNADGHQSTMCGNGGRCLVHLAHDLRLFKDNCIFEAVDGLHHAVVREDGNVELKMSDVSGFEMDGKGYVVHTGSPHLVHATQDVRSEDVFQRGRTFRNGERYRENGINVNFVQVVEGGIFVRTYERGVEDETLSCGTGVTASALMTPFLSDTFKRANHVPVKTLGGDLSVRFDRSGSTFKDVWLTGPATRVYEGQLKL